ncbi:MAG: ATP-binding cassette domain-containing protein [Sediminibacterium sp.]|nr:ATP-binding cassette domain-containing protein [Sediminibacterium sp.]MBP6144781.1 ATP-binding cassette domain-containing protein [Sediminibacterium sp.]
MEPLLSLSHLVKHYATQKAVDDISFDIQKGSIFGLLGPNGAGKTTLLRMITGIFYPDGGEIKLDGKHFDPLLDIREIGYMPEERGLYKKMKIGEQALYLAQLKGLSKAEAMERITYWFEKFEMQSWWNKKVEDLSKGMSQKLQFVITVLHEPKLIILDEPFSGLDPLNANLIKDEIYALAKKGATIIFSTHRMEQVEEICDHIVLVNLGKKILDGTVADIKQQYKEYIFAIETTHPELVKDNALFSIIEKEEKNPNKVLIKLSHAVASNEVLKYLIEQQVPITSYNEVLPSLNDIFIQLVEDTHAKARAFQNI